MHEMPQLTRLLAVAALLGRRLDMNIHEYRNAVIKLFKSGNAAKEQWDEMAAAVLDASETHGSTEAIDAAVYPDGARRG